MLAALLAPASAAAQDDVHWALKEQNRIGLDFDIWPWELSFFGNDIHIVSLAWGIPMQFRLVENVYLDANVSWAFYGVDTDGTDDGAAFGHITLGAHYADTPIEVLSWWAGGVIAIPTHLAAIDPTDGDDAPAAAAAGMAVASRAYSEPHRFAVLHLPIRPGAGIEVRPVDFLFIRTEWWFGQYIPLTDDPGFGLFFLADNDFEFIWEWPTEIELRAPFGLLGGLRFQQNFPLTTDPITGEDLVQLGLEQFIGYQQPDAGVYARLGWMWALDEALGFAFDDGKVMSVRLSVGGHW